MFRPEPMLKFELLVLERDERYVLQALAASGAVQLENTEFSGEALLHRDYAAEQQRCSQIINRAEEVRRSLSLPGAEGSQAGPVTLSLERLEDAVTAIAETVEPLLKRRADLREQWAQLTQGQQQIAKYSGAGLPLNSCDDYEFLHFVTGTLPEKSFDALQSALPDDSALLFLPKLNGRQPLIGMCTRASSKALRLALQRAGFEPEDLPQARGETVDSLIDQTRAEQARTVKLLAQLDAEMQAPGKRYSKMLAQYAAAAGIEQSLLAAKQNFARTASAVLITGWVPVADAEALRARLVDMTEGRCALQTTAADFRTQEDTPVLLRHPRWLGPFAALVGAYGLPRYNEVEPTLFVAISYLFMFGMMFGDVGHGAILAAIGCVCHSLGKKARWRSGGLLLLLAGLSSILFGLVYGSCFGLAGFKRFALWRDPLEGDPLNLISAAVAVGIGLISLGLVLNVINRFRAGDVLGAILDRFGLLGMVFYGGAVLLLVNVAAMPSRGLMPLALLVLLAMSLVGWALRKPLEYLLRRRGTAAPKPAEGWFGLFAESVVGSFEALLAYLANTISFVRLAAYAMSHAALLAAAFSLADAVGHSSFGATALGALIVIAGNLLALILEGIIASVQALRLEYYEFFSKFFSGAGKAFQPFRLGAMAG